MGSFHYLMELKRPAPCDDCLKRLLCKEKLMACRPFLNYVNSGRIVYDRREPTRELWQKIFVDDNDELLEEIA